MMNTMTHLTKLLKYNIDKFSKNRQGFTLVELIVSLSLLLLVLAVSQGFLFEAITSWQRGEAHIEVHESFRQGLDHISRELRTARELTGNNSNEIIFKNAENTSVKYSTFNNELVRITPIDSTSNETMRIITGFEVLSITATYHYDPDVPVESREIKDITRVEITLTGKIKGQAGVSSLSTSVALQSVR